MPLEEFLDSIAPALVELRAEHGITQAKLAETLGISQSLISKIEAGHLTPDLETWIKICYAFNLEFVFPKWIKTFSKAA